MDAPKRQLNRNQLSLTELISFVDSEKASIDDPADAIGRDLASGAMSKAITQADALATDAADASATLSNTSPLTVVDDALSGKPPPMQMSLVQSAAEDDCEADFDENMMSSPIATALMQRRAAFQAVKSQAPSDTDIAPEAALPRRPSFLTLTVPPDAAPGQAMQYTDPVSEQMMQIEVPAGLQPGATFQVPVASADMASEATQVDADMASEATQVAASAVATALAAAGEQAMPDAATTPPAQRIAASGVERPRPPPMQMSLVQAAEEEEDGGAFEPELSSPMATALMQRRAAFQSFAKNPPPESSPIATGLINRRAAFQAARAAEAGAQMEPVPGSPPLGPAAADDETADAAASAGATRALPTTTTPVTAAAPSEASNKASATAGKDAESRDTAAAVLVIVLTFALAWLLCGPTGSSSALPSSTHAASPLAGGTGGGSQAREVLASRVVGLLQASPLILANARTATAPLAAAAAQQTRQRLVQLSNASRTVIMPRAATLVREGKRALTDLSTAMPQGVPVAVSSKAKGLSKGVSRGVQAAGRRVRRLLERKTAGVPTTPS